MTDDQLLLLFWNSQEMAMTALTLYISVFSAYVAVAYLVGKNLNRTQVIFISVAYTVFSFFTIWGVYGYFNLGHRARNTLEGIAPDQVFIGVNPWQIIVPLLVVGVLGALKFMYDVRRNAEG